MTDPPTKQSSKPRDDLFSKFVAALISVMLLYGLGAVAVALWGDGNLARVMLTAFSSMFAGVLGLGSGYLLGRNGNGH